MFPQMGFIEWVYRFMEARMVAKVVYNWSSPAGLIDGTGNITEIGAASATNIAAVEVHKADQGDGTFAFTDNRGHTLVGIERLFTSRHADVLDLEYSLTDSASWLSGSIIEVRTFGGDDVVKIGDTLPADYGKGRGPGALVVGGAGDDRIVGGKENDVLYGDTDALGTESGNDILKGGAGDDELYGDDGNDKLFGGDGDDRMTGDLGTAVKGRDEFTGGRGADFIILGSDGKGDRVFYDAVSDSTRKASDNVVGFEAARDLIDLTAIDADKSMKGDQAFELVRNLSGHAGELQAKITDIGYTFDVRLAGDVNGDGVTDFFLEVNIEADKLTMAILGDCLLL
jgi:Ca2+-binding RTX toxin-like protein